MLDSVTLGGEDETQILMPGRLWDLWDMYNFVLREFDVALATIEMFALQNPFDQSPHLTREQSKTIRESLMPLPATFRKLEMESSAELVESIIQSVSGLLPRPSKADFETRCTVALQAIRKATKAVNFYYYPKAKAKILENVETEWEAVFKAFPSAKADIVAGVDLWALGHATASIFHMMRAAELALRALAHERQVKITKGKPLEWETWGTILKALKTKTDEIHNKKNGPRKDEALSFYADALGHMTSLKDKYRDQVNHVRRTYDEHEAMSAITHVREMMTGLSKKLDERSTKAIAWGLR